MIILAELEWIIARKEYEFKETLVNVNEIRLVQVRPEKDRLYLMLWLKEEEDKPRKFAAAYKNGKNTVLEENAESVLNDLSTFLKRH